MKQLVDKFGRVHDYLRISLTDHCNLRCTYCMPAEPHFLVRESHTTPEEIFGIAEVFVKEFGVRKIRLTGGEPLMRREAPEIMRSLASLGVKLAITTNGVLLHQYFGVLKECGFTSLNISLDSFDPARFEELTRRNLYARIRENVDAAHREGFHVKLNFVAIRGVNEPEIPDFVALTREERMHVRFIEFMPFSGNTWEWDKVLPCADILNSLRSRFDIEKIDDSPHSTSRAWRVKGFAGTFAIISTVTEPFCSTCNRIRLTADGKLRNCLFAQQETDLLGAWRRGEDIRPLIESAIAAKEKQLGGLPAFTEREALMQALSRRSMVKIGG